MSLGSVVKMDMQTHTLTDSMVIPYACCLLLSKGSKHKECHKQFGETCTWAGQYNTACC